MKTMDSYPYHTYLFFHVDNGFYQQPQAKQDEQKKEFQNCVKNITKLVITPYITLGMKADTTFMLWSWAKDPADTPGAVRDMLHTSFGQWLRVSYSYFGIERESQYSGRKGNPDQVIQNFTERLPYLILYPFTKTTDWYLLDFENRRSMMGQHIKIGIGYPAIRQCLLYSYGVDNYEFLVSYESNTLEEFQDLIIKLRSTLGRTYTLIDTPIYTCIHKPIKELAEWL